MFEKIRQWYNQGLWSATMVHQALIKKVISEYEYQEIMGGKINDKNR